MRTALLLIDFINPLDFEGRHKLASSALRAARAAAALKVRVKAAGHPIIYVNDNFGRWRSNFLQVIDACRSAAEPAPQMVDLLKPEHDDYFVLKPRHSGFFLTPLELLLSHLRARRLILTGILTDSCVLFTGNDAYLREYRVSIAKDCVATLTARRSKQALDYMQRTLKADIRPSRSMTFRREQRGRRRVAL